MSWIDQANNDLIIFTGDGKEYRPLWKDPNKATDYNVTSFDFPGVQGSLVSRGTRKGRKIPLEIYFQGDDHLDVAEAFESSADDERPWLIIHPYYGSINVQPVSLNIDNTDGNVSKINISLLETIIEDNPRITINPTDKIISDVANLQDILSASFVVDIPKPDVSNIQLMSKNVNAIYEEGAKTLRETINAEEYFNLFNDAEAAILKATSFPLEAINTTLAMIHAPFQFAETVKNRVNLLLNQFGLLSTSVINLLTPSDKIIYEKNASYIIGTMAEASVTNIDYQSSVDALAVMEILMSTYDQFVADLDSLQTPNGGTEDSYVADHDSMLQLQSIVDFTVSKLIEIALDSKQERSIILEEDSNVIILTHRFYGLQIDDSTIDYLIQTNNFGLNDNLQIKKGRKILYYT